MLFTPSDKHLRSWVPNPVYSPLYRQRGSAKSPYWRPRGRVLKPSGSSMSIWSSECFYKEGRGSGSPSSSFPLAFILIKNESTFNRAGTTRAWNANKLFLLPWELHNCHYCNCNKRGCSYFHPFIHSFCLHRFVGDQEAWHELSELYINEHE